MLNFYPKKNKILKIKQFLLVFILISSWIFSGWPQIFNFPMENQEASADSTPTGGTITTDGNYTVHTFTTGGTFTPVKTANIEVLVVAGGGGGAAMTGGGGGAGGLLYDNNYIIVVQPYNVTVGNGGAGQVGSTNPGNGSDGQNSIFDNLISIGGGGAGTNSGTGRPGGSGGGAGHNNTTGGLGTTGQGNNGSGGTTSAPNYGAGGGGGAGAVGGTPTNTNGGNGGIGLQYSISGTPTYYAGGGGGGTYSGGTYGLGGNGGGGNAPSGNGTPNTGGGGGGQINNQANGGNGGSGIVIVRYLTSSQSGDISTSPIVTTQAVNNITRTTATGNGNVVSDGGESITERGIVWNTSTNPTTANGKATSTGTTGAYTASLSSLTSDTLYYVRSFATNSVGTSYGSNVTFTTASANITPTGGTITTDGNYTVHTFTTGGTFTPVKPGNIEVLVVAGGGGGGAFAGGGGAGGLVYNSAFAVTANVYSVTIGVGGNGGVISDTGDNGINGTNSIFGSGSITATGGGGGGARGSGYTGQAGNNGGSGGGGGPADSGILGLGGNASPVGQGYKGGDELSFGWGGGGGGGAGASGGDAIGNEAGVGGTGVNTYSDLLIAANAGVDIVGVHWIAGGGGGGTYSGGAGSAKSGGAGGGGAGSKTGNATSGTPNTGGGGGGSAYQAIGGNGGSGIIIIRYLTSSQSLPLATGLSCSITTSALCTGTVILRMSGSTNAHAELPSQSTAVYDNNVVCCTGVTGLGNSCAVSNKEIFARLSGVTNAHIERNTEANANYTTNACLSSTFAGDEITIGYQTNNCTGYDTTLFSMSNTPTNSMVGGPNEYNNKVCAKIFSQSITFNISNNNVGFGLLNPTGLRFATSDGQGSSNETESYSITVSTNASYGYGLYVRGDPLKNGSKVITAIGGTNMTPTAGTKAFGIRAVATGGTGAVQSPYDGAGFGYDANGSNATIVGQTASGDGVTTTYSIRTVATIDSLLDSGNYSTNLTYIVTANY